LFWQSSLLGPEQEVKFYSLYWTPFFTPNTKIHRSPVYSRKNVNCRMLER
jgi:hypothetical protein